MSHFDVDDLEETTAQYEFVKAVEFTGTQPTNMPEDVQRRLYGLHCCATRGKAPAKPPAMTVGDDALRAQYDAWRDASDATATPTEAMHEYVDLVTAYCPKFGDDPDDQDEATLNTLKDQLASSGFREAARPDDAPPLDVFEAARSGAEVLARFLPDGAAEVDEEGLSALIHAVDAEQLEAVEALLDAGADVDGGDAEGSAPLHYAALLGAEGLCELLKERGASLTLQNDDGMTAADVAADEGWHELADFLRSTKTKAANPEDVVVEGRKVAPAQGKAGTTLPRNLLEKR